VIGGSRLEDVQRLKNRTYDAFGEVAVLMNNAISWSSTVAVAGREEWKFMRIM
jgi:hypothetical protein